MWKVHALDLVHYPFVPSACCGTPVPATGSLSAPVFDGSSVAGAASTLAKLAFANLIGLAFVVVLPFAGIAVLSWFAARALRGSTASDPQRRAPQP